jgi:hypothetical protein
MLEVPEYVCGFPLYDLNSCIKYLIDSLKVNGFLVKYYFPKVLYISWDFEEIKNENKPPPPQVQSQYIVEKKSYEKPKASSRSPYLTSSLASKGPTCLNMKPTGKLALNLY